jgi:uncharacterized membrane protein
MPAWMLWVAAVGLPLAFWLLRWLHWPFWLAGALLLPLALIRRTTDWRGRAIAAGAALLGIGALAWQSDLPVRFYPVFVNGIGLMAFGISLRHPPTMIERFARLKNPGLSAEAIRYTRAVTVAWCGFFLANGAIALYTTLATDERIWALYNGFISYVLMGAMFAGEFLIRRRIRRRSRAP